MCTRGKNQRAWQLDVKQMQKYLLQFDWIMMKQGALHWIYITSDVESHQLVLPKEYHQAMLHMLHDDYSHHGFDCTSALLSERFYWSTMYQDVTEYFTNCHQCHVAKGHYICPHTQLGFLVANNPLDLLCIDFLKVDPSKDSKESVLVLTDAFTKFNEAFVTNNQKALTIAMILVDKWSSIGFCPAFTCNRMEWVHPNTTGNRFFYYTWAQNYETCLLPKYVVYIHQSSFINVQTVTQMSMLQFI